jgi:hypothetical protein
MIISKLATIFFDTWNATMPEEKHAVIMKENYCSYKRQTNP